MADAKYPLLWNIRYAMRFGRLQGKLLDRIALGIKILIFVSGATAFATAFADYPEIIRWSAASAGVLAILDALWNPSRLSAKAREMALRYALLNRDAATMTAEALQREVDALNAMTDHPDIEALRPVAYNDTVEELGNDPASKYSLNGWQKVVAMLA